MAQLDQLMAEFEAIGEAEVSSRVQANAYQGPARALAMRWLSQRALSRTGAAVVHANSFSEAQVKLTRRAENAARMAMLGAGVALLLAAGALGVSVQAMRTARSFEPAAAPAAPAAKP